MYLTVEQLMFLMIQPDILIEKEDMRFLPFPLYHNQIIFYLVWCNEALSHTKQLGCNEWYVANFIKWNLIFFKYSQTYIKNF